MYVFSQGMYMHIDQFTEKNIQSTIASQNRTQHFKTRNVNTVYKCFKALSLFKRWKYVFFIRIEQKYRICLFSIIFHLLNHAFDLKATKMHL